MNTTSEGWELLDKIRGSVNADILRGWLEAQGIEVQTFQESIGKTAYPGTFGFLSEVELYVKAADLEHAQELLTEFESELYDQGENSEAAAQDEPPPSE